MTVIDDARTAGFSEDEIADWSNGQRDSWREAGFSDQEIDQQLTGLKNPRQIPQPLVDRVFNTIGGVGEEAGRLYQAGAEGFSAGFGETPIGPTQEEKRKLLPGVPAEIADKTRWPAVYSGAEALFRGVNGALMGAGAMVGQGVADVTGADEATAARARRDFANLVSIGAMLAGGERVARPGPAGDEVIGHLPTTQDFTDATKAVTGGTVPEATRQRVVDLYQDHGVHPAEVAADARGNPGNATALRNGELPEGYSEPTAPEGPSVTQPSPPVGQIPEGLSADAIPNKRYAAAARNDEVLRGDVQGNDNGAPPPGGFGSSPQQPPRAPYFTYDDRPLIQKTFEGAIRGYKETFQPELVSDAALTADPLFARYRSMQAMSRDSVVARAEDGHQMWRQVPEAERLTYMDAVERGQPVAEQFQEAAERHREILHNAHEMEQQAGSKGGYVTDYFPHIWQDPVQARDFTAARVAQLGPKWFQKERTFDFIQEGLDAGLRLKSTNPEDMVTMRLLASADMRERMNLLGSLKEMGLATEAKGAPSDLARSGWSAVNAPSMDQWLLAPDIQPLWKNAVEAKGFWANEGAAGSVFRGWMGLKAVWVPIKLALSAFHPLHVLHINFSGQYPAIAWKQLGSGDVLGAFKSVAEGLYGPLQAAIPYVPHLGKDVRSAWLLPDAERTPEQRAAVSLMHDGGFVPQISEELKIAGKRSLEEAWDKSQWFKAMPLALREGVKLIQAPLFEEWIPNLKAAAYLNETQAMLARRPDLLDNAEQRGVALRTIAKSIDNRYGEMHYGSVFWNRYVKDAGIGTFLSLGWNLGFLREFGGGVLQPEIQTVRRLMGRETVSEATIRQAQSKVAFATSYVAGAMMINGLMTYMLSGQMPSGMDWFLARTGGNNPDGSPRRITNMSYLREVPMLLKHVQEQGGNIAAGVMEMLYNKMVIQPFVDMAKNRDYYGNDIWDENGPIYRKAWQAVSYLFKDQLNPIAVSGAQRAVSLGGGSRDVALSFMGFGPAPAYAEKSGTQNRIGYLFQRHVAPYARPEEMGEKSKTRGDIRNEILLAKQRDDKVAMAEASQRWFKAGGSRQGLNNIMNGVPSDVGMFRSLPETDQQAIMEQATNEERTRYQPFLKNNITSRAADMVVDAEKARQSGDTATAAELQQRLGTLLTQGVRDGHITNVRRFSTDLGKQIVSRYAPDISALLSQPKRMQRGPQ